MKMQVLKIPEILYGKSQEMYRFFATNQIKEEKKSNLSISEDGKERFLFKYTHLDIYSFLKVLLYKTC